MHKPRLSIVVPIYNAEKHLKSCLSSICRQTFLDWECICVDNHSSDQSLEMLRTIARCESRFVIAEESRQGVSYARNKGIALVRGEWLSFVDSDDELKDDYYAQLFRLVDFYTQADIIVSSATLRNADGEERDKDPKCEILPIAGDALSELCRMGLSTTTYYVWDKLFRYSLCVEGCLRFDQRLNIGEDMLFCQKALEQARFVVVDLQNRGYVHKFHRGSLSDSIRYEDIANMVFAAHEMVKLYFKTKSKGCELAAINWGRGLFKSGKRMSNTEKKKLCNQLLCYEQEFAEVVNFLLATKPWFIRLMVDCIRYLPVEVRKTLYYLWISHNYS